MNEVKILIVEDESIIALEVELALKSIGYIITDTTSTYEDSIKSVKENPPALVLVDINIASVKDGIETAREIKKLCGASIVFITAYTDPNTLQKACDVEPCGFIEKPFTMSQLISSIAVALKKRGINEIHQNKYKILEEEQNRKFKSLQSVLYSLSNSDADPNHTKEAIKYIADTLDR